VEARNVSGKTISDAWVNAVRAVAQLPGHEAFQLVVRIENPTKELPEVRKMIDKLLRARGLQPVSTVASTIFPTWSSKITNGPRELASRDKKHYSTLKKFSGNAQGTYFGRLVKGPQKAPPMDQLNHVIDKLNARANVRMRAIYEIDLADGEGEDLQIYRYSTDRRKRMGFPCLSSCSFQREGDLLHFTALYRNHYLVERGYGNYLGLSRLLQYVAKHTRTRAGEMLVVSGHAVIDVPLTILRTALSRVHQ
jgi:hypothetical protein